MDIENTHKTVKNQLIAQKWISTRLYDSYRNIFKNHPFQELPTSSRIVEEVLNNDMIRQILNF